MLEAGQFSDADRKFAESVDITPTIAYHTLKYVQKYYKKVECIVAPYEADAQLAYLSRIGYIDGVVTEDSDLIVFGAKLILYKLKNDHTCTVIDNKNIFEVSNLNFN